jgi:hypothetical protein
LIGLGAAAEPWLRWHCDQIVENINQSGGQNPDIFDTGLLDDEALYFLMDLVESKGFDEGLQATGRRTERLAVKTVASRAAVLRWMLLILGLATVATVLVLTMGTIFQMKGAIMSTMGG